MMFEVNQQVISSTYGIGIITNIRSGDTYPIKVRFANSEETFTKAGLYQTRDTSNFIELYLGLNTTIIGSNLVQDTEDSILVIPISDVYKATKFKAYTKYTEISITEELFEQLKPIILGIEYTIKIT